MNTPPHPRKTAAPVEDAEGVYAKYRKIYPRKAHGLFTRLKAASVLILLGIFYIAPWLWWGERQAVLFDLPARKFYLFGFTFWPQDFIYLTSLLIIAALSLFFFTTLAGRLWCGFACPQTVWTEFFIWMDRWVEGDRQAQIKLDKSPWTARKIRIKLTKHSVWIVFSLFTGFTFVGYFSPIVDLSHRLFTFNLGPWETFWFLFYGFATYGNAGGLREQICIYMCPYARFQSAMFDRNTLIIAYDEKRGEPRGARKKTEDPKTKGLGDCVSCTWCVQVCPMGIDIRDGLQYQCISCSACIDACDEIMRKMNYPLGLVRYTTENTLEGQSTHIFRPRVFIYALILLGIFSAIIYGVITRTPLGLDIIRDRNSLYRETPEGKIENVYLLKILNMDEQAHDFRLQADGIEGLQLKMDAPLIPVAAGMVVETAVRLQVDPAHLTKQSQHIYFTLSAVDEPSLTTRQAGRFLGPIFR